MRAVWGGGGGITEELEEVDLISGRGSDLISAMISGRSLLSCLISSLGSCFGISNLKDSLDTGGCSYFIFSGLRSSGSLLICSGLIIPTGGGYEGMDALDKWVERGGAGGGMLGEGFPATTEA